MDCLSPLFSSLFILKTGFLEREPVFSFHFVFTDGGNDRRGASGLP
jgi:hypothetical protein